jgi:4-hydroxy-4-methyl-2-oxoglutarate aldolase
VDLGGVRIDSGDILIGDRDGVVVVPRGRAGEILKALEAVRAAESALDAKVKGGLRIPDFVLEILKSTRVRSLD